VPKSSKPSPRSRIEGPVPSPHFTHRAVVERELVVTELMHQEEIDGGEMPPPQ